MNETNNEFVRLNTGIIIAMDKPHSMAELDFKLAIGLLYMKEAIVMK